MAIDFPNSPTVGQIYTSGDKSWIWDGTVWKAYGASLSPTVLKVDSTNSRVGINNQSPATALDITGALTVSGDVTVDTSTLKVDSTNNRVGVVNASPAYALDVTGDINASSALRIAGTNIGASQTFTPTIVGNGGGSVTISNGTLTGTYFRIGKLIVANYVLTWGSNTSTTASGLWLFSVPVGNAVSGNAFGRILDAGNTYYRVTGLAGSNKMVLQATDTGSEVQNTIPMTWATNDTLVATFVYETSA